MLACMERRILDCASSACAQKQSFWTPNRMEYPDMALVALSWEQTHEITLETPCHTKHTLSWFPSTALRAHLLTHSVSWLQYDDGAVAELADAEDLKSSEGDLVWVRIPPALLSCEKDPRKNSFDRGTNTHHVQLENAGSI